MRRLALLAAVLAACGSACAVAPTNPIVAGDREGPGISGDLTVFAAASLRDAFSSMAQAFGLEHPDLDVVFNFAGSQQLAGQILAGAPADVYAAASPGQMRRLVDAGVTHGEPRVFARNLLVIAVEPGNPRGIGGLADLARSDLVVVLAAPTVPAGEYAAEALERAGVEVSPSSLETDVRAVLSKVSLGEADAGVVYQSDVVAAGGDVEGVTIPASQNVPATYPIAAMRDAANPDAARGFVDFVISEAGREILVTHGFKSP